MRKQIWPKLRFQILERDKHTCQYCWAKAPRVQLEIDHIVSVKDWWDNSIKNLITSCFDCNRWKWWASKTENKWRKTELYKKKLSELVWRYKVEFFKQWNNAKMGEIDWLTMQLLSIYVYDYIKWEDWNNYTSYLDILWERTANNKELERRNNLFMEWWEYCDEVIDFMFDMAVDSIEGDIEYIYSNENWRWDRDNDYTWKLNFLLTSYWGWPFYIIKKFSLYPNVYEND